VAGHVASGKLPLALSKVAVLTPIADPSAMAANITSGMEVFAGVEGGQSVARLECEGGPSCDSISEGGLSFECSGCEFEGLKGGSVCKL